MVIARGAQMMASDILNLTFFPKGAVIMYSSAAWNSASAEFKTYWHICDGTTIGDYTTLNLVDKFIRGGTASGETGGTDTTQVPYHTHGITEPNGGAGHTHLQEEHTHIQDKHSHPIPTSSNDDGGVANDCGKRDDWKEYTDETIATNQKTTAVNKNAVTGISINYVGSATADNRPAFCSLIFIEKVK